MRCCSALRPRYAVTFLRASRLIVAKRPPTPREMRDRMLLPQRWGQITTGSEKHHHKLKGVPFTYRTEERLATGSGNAITNSKVYPSLTEPRGLSAGSGNAITNSKVYPLRRSFGLASHATWTRSSVVAWFIFQCAVAFLHPVAKAPRFRTIRLHYSAAAAPGSRGWGPRSTPGSVLSGT